MELRQKAVKIIQDLSEKKVEAAIYILEILAKMSKEEDMEENIELLGSLDIAEPVLEDWKTLMIQ